MGTVLEKSTVTWSESRLQPLAPSVITAMKQTARKLVTLTGLLLFMGPR
jgi:hypothetical protein